MRAEPARHWSTAAALALLLVGLPRAALTQGSRSTDTVVTVRLSGTVFDSMARAPLVNATVRAVRPDAPGEGFTTRSGADGRFLMPALPRGTWLVSFLHPRLDALRVEAPVARVEVVEPGELAVPLAIPGGETLARSLCGAPVEDSTAVLVGEVRSAGGAQPLPDAAVQARWPEWVFANRRLDREDVRRTVRTDVTGRFVLCGVPQGTTVTALAVAHGDSTGVIELAMPEQAYVITDFFVDTGGALARGAVRGRVVAADGRPVDGALARILGSGSAVRTDSTGTFRISGAAAGTQTLEVRALGYGLRRTTVMLPPDDPLPAELVLERASVRLDTVRVAAGRAMPPDLVRLERRWRQGFGTVMDAATVRERATLGVSSALMGMPGVRLGTRAGFGNVIYMRSTGGGECRPPIFLDGFRFIAGEQTIDELVHRDDVAALEVYARPQLAPPDLSDPLSGCGTVVVWTKRFFGNIPVLNPRARRP